MKTYAAYIFYEYYEPGHPDYYRYFGLGTDELNLWKAACEAMFGKGRTA